MTYGMAMSAMVAIFAACTPNTQTSLQDVASSAVMAESGNRAAEAGLEAKLSLARQWEVKGQFTITFKINGQFEAYFSPDVLSTGTWSIDDNQTELRIVEEKAAEGKGSTLNLVYKITEINEEEQTMTVQDAEGKTLVFIGK